MNAYLSLLRIFGFPLILILVLLNSFARPTVAQNSGVTLPATVHLHPGKKPNNDGSASPNTLVAKQADLRPGPAANFNPDLATNVPNTDASRDWTTYGFDMQRTGYNPKELNSKLGPSTVQGLHRLWVTDLGGWISDAQPVYAHNVNVNGKAADILYVGTESGVFYAIDAISGQRIWSRQLGTAIATSCGDYEQGIAGTAVLDRGKFYKDRVYVADGQNNVYALNLADGSIIWGPINVASPDHLHIYSALNVSGGNLYVSVASYCDDNPYQGGVFEISKIGTSRAFLFKKFLPTQGYNGGGIWGVGGVSIDPSSLNVYAATGNAHDNNVAENYGYADQIVSLGTYLTPIASNYPPGLVVEDSDFGATPTLFDAPSTGCSKSLLAAKNKSGTLHIYDRNNIQNGQLQYLQVAPPSANGNFIGVPAFSPMNNYLYVSSPQAYGSYTHGMIAFKVTSNCTLDPNPVWQTQVNADNNGPDDPYSPPTVANGVVYMADGSGGNLVAFDAQNGSQLFTVSGIGPAYVPPIVVDGRVFIGSYSNKLSAFGL